MVSCPEESTRIVAHKNVTFKMDFKKQEAQSLRMKMRNAELYLKGTTVILRLAAACSRLQPLAAACSRLQQHCLKQRQSWKD